MGKNTKKSDTVFSLNITKNQYANVFDQFVEQRGYMTKLIDKFSWCAPITAGWLIRAEIPEYKDFIAITFAPNYIDRSHRFNKARGINRVMTAGKRKLDKWVKKNGSTESFMSESIMDKSKYFITVDEFETEFPSASAEEKEKYKEFVDYILVFENKIQKYYGDKKVKIVVV
jgi:hypothetical protein